MQQKVIQESMVQKPEFEIDPAKYQQFLYQIDGNQNLPLGILCGAVAALIGSTAWAAVTVLTKYQIGWMAVGVGFLVGYAVRVFGKGISKIYGMVGAVLSLMGCLVGNLLSLCAILSKQEGIPFFDLLTRLNPEVIVKLLWTTFSPIDLLFYGIAIYEGYRFSFRQLTQEEAAGLVRTKS